MKLTNTSIQIGAINIQDDFEQAKGLTRMLDGLKKETKPQRDDRLSKRKYICGVINPKYKGG